VDSRQRFTFKTIILEKEMSTSNEQDVIVFDNLFRPTGNVVGELQPVKAVRPTTEPFVSPNAAGDIREVNELDDIKKCASHSGTNLKAAFGL
jgi:hypothetical protein